MSLTATQLKDKLHRALGTDTNSYTTAQQIDDLNLALDEALATIFKISKSGWQFDDSNHTSDPVLTANLVDGTRAYDFSEDAGGNLTLDVYRVMVADSSGNFRTIDPISQRTGSEDEVSTFFDGDDGEGTPTQYDKRGMKILLDPIPSYNYTNGLKVFINRQASYFNVNSTSTVAGIDGLCHDFLYLKPAYEWARDHGLQNTERLFRDLQVAKDKIVQRYGTREKDAIKRMMPASQDNR